MDERTEPIGGARPTRGPQPQRRSVHVVVSGLILCLVVALVASGCSSRSDGVVAADGAQETVSGQDPAPMQDAPASTEAAAADGAESVGNAEQPVRTDAAGLEPPPALERPDTPDAADNEPAATAPVVDATTAATVTPVVGPRQAAPNGRTAPDVAATPAELVAQIIEAERGLRDQSMSDEQLAEFGHLQQVAYRKLGREDDWTNEVLSSLPDDLRGDVELHVNARRALRGLHSGFATADFVPAWEIIEPEPAEDLFSYWLEAEQNTGVDWEYLAAINLIETGMGRIRGLSSAGAQGPMQFLPTTWEEVGEGDINNPRDAIAGAARYLVRRGGPADMEAALWGYNNSDEYVETVSLYAELMRRNSRNLIGLYNWEIYFRTDAGDVWLPVGFRTTESIDLDDYLADAPWSTPDPNLG